MGKPGIRHPGRFRQRVSEKTKRDILVAVAVPWITDKGDLLQPTQDIFVTYDILYQVGISMRHQARGLVGEVKQLELFGALSIAPVKLGQQRRDGRAPMKLTLIDSQSNGRRGERLGQTG